MNIPCILSIQSSIVYGRVGNSAAVPIHAIFGHETLRVDSVVLATHPGIKQATKFITPCNQIHCLLDELTKIMRSDEIDAIQTGYLGKVEQIDIICPFIKRHSQSLYVYDPVFGDNGALYVDEVLAIKSKKKLLPLANIITPNMFELSYISEIDVTDINTAIEASKVIQANGTKWVLSTGIFSTKNEVADILVGPKTIDIFRQKRQRLGISGAGDTLAAILTSLLVSGETVPSAVKKACSITHSLIKLSQSSQSMPPLKRELIK